MRTIKFRAKAKGSPHVQDGTFLFGSLVLDCNEKPIIDIQGYVDGFGVHYQHPVDAETVGQFTGLLDRNGKEIYEGDIISGDNNTRHVVEYDQERSCFTCVLLGSDDNNVKCIIGYKLGGISQDWISKYGKVVSGNIHDNPELIKGGCK